MNMETGDLLYEDGSLSIYVGNSLSHPRLASLIAKFNETFKEPPKSFICLKLKDADVNSMPIAIYGQQEGHECQIDGGEVDVDLKALLPSFGNLQLVSKECGKDELNLIVYSALVANPDRNILQRLIKPILVNAHSNISFGLPLESGKLLNSGIIIENDHIQVETTEIQQPENPNDTTQDVLNFSALHNYVSANEDAVKDNIPRESAKIDDSNWFLNLAVKFEKLKAGPKFSADHNSNINKVSNELASSDELPSSEERAKQVQTLAYI